MFIELPEGLVEEGFLPKEEAEEHCIQLMNSMYGNVDAALRRILEKTENLTSKEIRMIQSRSDPCVFYKRDQHGEPALIVTMTVDDCAVGGTIESIDWLLNKIEQKFTITQGGQIRKHLGVDYTWLIDENDDPYIEVWMEKKRESIVKAYENWKGKICKVRKTPSAPGSYLKKNQGEITNIKEYRSFEGKIMFDATKVCPKIVNATRELATHMSNPGEEHWKAMEHLVGYIRGTIGEPAMILHKPKEMRAVSFVDASNANGVERRSVSGELNTVGGMISAFSSRTQKTTSMSSAESEYVAACSAAQS